MIRIIQRRWISYLFSGVLAVLSITALITWGLKFGIDFNGGSLLEVEFANHRPTADEVSKVLATTDIGEIVQQPTGERGLILRFANVDETKHQQIVKQLGEAGGGTVAEKQFQAVGPTVGSELKSRALWAVAVALFFIVSYISWAFRKVSYPVPSWKYGIAAIVALAHDIVIPLGVFSVLGHYLGVELDALFVSAILTVLGFSVHDTIVVFDRIRENLFRNATADFVETVNRSVNDTIMRSINTSLTTLLVLVALFLFGGVSIHYFVLVLIVGITVGTYSSIFVASPLVVDSYRWARPAKLRR